MTVEKIHRASDKRLRDQIHKRLTDLETAVNAAIAASISDAAYNATTWNGVTTIAPSKNAVRDVIETLVAESDYDANTILAANSDNTPLALTVAEETLVGRITGGNIDDLSVSQVRTLLNVLARSAYQPGMMYYAGGYYVRNGVTVSGNKVTVVIHFRVSSGAATDNQRLLTVSDSTTRFSLTVLENDHATASAREKLQMVVQNSSGTNVAVITSSSTVTAGFHTCFLSYDGDAGTASMIINGADEKDTGSPLHVLTAGSLETGSMSFYVGSSAVPDLYASALIGSFGYGDVGGLSWSDFMGATGGPSIIDESPSWPTWGGQPLFWNSNGQLDRNRGSAGDMLKMGVVLASSESFDLATGWDTIISGNFTPTLWDSSNSDSESQTYTEQTGRYRRQGDLVNIWIDITVNSIGTLNTAEGIKIGGIPFTSKGPVNGGAASAFQIGIGTSLAITAGHTVTAYLPPGNTSIQLLKWSATTGTSALTVGEYSAGGRVVLSGAYIAA